MSPVDAPERAPTDATAGGTEQGGALPDELGPITDPLQQPSSGLGQMTLADVGAALRRYRPVLAAAAAVAVLGLLLPGPRTVIARQFDDSSISTSALSGFEEDEESQEAAVDGAVDGAAPDSFADGFDPGPTPAFADGGGDFDYSPSPPTQNFSSPASTESTGSEARATTPQPLRVREAGWATRAAGTPLAAEGVPEKSLPVAKRVGQDDKQSFLRLSGNATVLTLRPTAGGRSVENAIVRACPIAVGDWKASEGMAWDARPAFSTTNCVDGARNAGGEWVFDLTSMPERLTAKGIALVPGGGSTIDFQIAFERG